jgi:hypothetical protein
MDSTASLLGDEIEAMIARVTRRLVEEKAGALTEQTGQHLVAKSGAALTRLQALQRSVSKPPATVSSAPVQRSAASKKRRPLAASST